MEPNTFSTEMSTGSEINEDLHDGVEISLGTPVVALNKSTLLISSREIFKYKQLIVIK